MSTNVGSIHYDLKLDTSAFDKAVSNVSNKAQAVGKKMVSMGKTMTMGVTLPVVAGFGYAIKAASDLQETMNKVDVSFKDQAGEVKEWAKTSLTSMGLARQSALDATALFGDMSTSMGLNTKEAATMSMGLTQLGADLASFKNVSFERAQVALAGVYTGETEALKGLGVVMTEGNLAAFAQSRGIKKNIQDMTQAEKVQLRYAYVMGVTKNAQGDFARTSESTANQIRMTKERFKELSAQVGDRLTPIFGRLLEKLNKVLDWFEKLSPKTQDFILTTIAIGAALGPVLFIIGNLIGAIRGIAMAMSFVVAHPAILAITLVLLAIGAIAYVIIRNWDTLKKWFATFLGWLKAAWNATWGIIKAVIMAAVNKIRSDLQRIRDIASAVMNFIRNVVRSRINEIKAIFSGIKSAVTSVFTFIRNVIRDRINEIKSFIQGIKDKAVQVMNGVKDTLVSPFTAAKNKISGIMGGIKGAMDRINPFHRESPSLVDNIQAGTRAMVKSYAGALGKIRSMASSTKMELNGVTSTSPNVNTSIYGNVNIGSEVDSRNFLSQLSRNQELARMGMPTRAGTLG